MAHYPHEGEPDQQATTSVNTADLLRLLGQVPGGLADADAVRMAALAHGIDFGAAAEDTAGFPLPTAESYPYQDGRPAAERGVHFVEDHRPVLGQADGDQPGTAFRNVRGSRTGAPGKARPGWPAVTDHHLVDGACPPILI
jgi:hypothetical protein